MEMLNTLIYNHKKMKPHNIIIPIFFILSSCQENTSKGGNFKLDSLTSERLKLALITKPSEIGLVINKNSIIWNPSDKNMLEIDTILRQAVKENCKSYYGKLKLDSLDKFYRQYICYIDSTGDSLVYINAICHIGNEEFGDEINGTVKFKRFDWQNKFFLVNDGGSCYWNIIINVSKKIYYKLSVNGRA